MNNNPSTLNYDTFWKDSEYFTHFEPVTDAMVRRTEQLLGYKLPSSYIDLIRTRNGGSPVRSCFPTAASTSWAEDHIAISGICGIGGQWGIDSEELGSRFMIEEWGYPDIGIVVCECPSAGHDAVMLDYSACGPEGEPQVIHVDVETGGEPRRTFLAEDFQSFLEGLVHESAYEEDPEGLRQAELAIARGGAFPPLLAELCRHADDPLLAEAALRHFGEALVEEKGFFALHADPLSYLLYDLQFWLYSRLYPVESLPGYLEAYSGMTAFGGEFGASGYAPSFVSDWFNLRLEEGRITTEGGRLAFTESYARELAARLEEARRP
ncbi:MULTISPECIES: SMI1/KNR4 family protein [Paenibacillus]|uniref:SMI1/KNR4 family protein n=1 Tax=Paenibacillus TaxID=44249 RepID=UPI0022B8AD51|nr:SMI1/KNR4 family protein [Paenibacillus caseinilyticus]MCZ8524002.1 SMI1/KNR4 family protein [Paenibacillus caseinilyticus]